MDEHPLPRADFISAVTTGDFERALAMAPHSLRDMAGDGISLLDRLGIAQSHMVRSSVGGTIAHKMAIEASARAFPEQPGQQ